MAVAPDFFETEPRNWRARLAASVEVMRELSRYSDPQEMYAVFARRMAQLFPVSRQLTVSRRGLDAPQFRVTRYNLWRDPVNPWKDWQRLPVHEGGLLAELVYADQPRVLEDVALDRDDPALAYLEGQRSVLALPHFDQGIAHNVVILAREEPDAFPRDRIADLVLLSNLFGRATQTLVLSQAVKEAYEAVDYELRTVADIQKSLLPPSVPRVPGLDVAVHYQTAKRAGGDYYDFFPLPDGKLGVLVADASGHGAPAAVLMAIAHSIAHTLPDPPVRPAALLTHLNAHMTKRYTRQTGNFMTAFYAVFDPAAGTLSYASAGHNPPRLVRAADGSRVILNRAQSLPLGIKPDERYPEQVVPLHAGDRVVFFTDGVIEAVNAEGDVFGPDRLDATTDEPAASAEELLRAVLRGFNRFTEGVPVADDRTLVVVCRS
ncbi:stage ii sporulation protein e : Stage II sporulation E family protein OS=Planctomyces limnophilus (strain ATCC 43296 / DSM 3776 / IFAM 1008 / 290) GN=Plim_3158 PE=4 SV=1: SpoIIE [Gemmataceae bacterium]|nr:stage ii sporulation protein e : Stage II sporulation E family protein OS=Planctomyces limnophilus (strain ATCC 43296 / DSM 3776 / IFAM 1008 / 290) GN=Plim_3158 PE=4 SV=1: SpoIIE [Gemmataceae bacterium]VTU02680.1 stage ii sporulation protein e : Stage II sporulation E family protein OS=Planctomyces limnophilus (strain ATCC 43296 / DSM 3776 / IFAM 1008 / 290) GN=Plim_3158 PE=4 SV=1: SpoIIE [Gemmataceae bacterium]